jgi:hypothetical protein
MRSREAAQLAIKNRQLAVEEVDRRERGLDDRLAGGGELAGAQPAAPGRFRELAADRDAVMKQLRGEFVLSGVPASRTAKGEVVAHTVVSPTRGRRGMEGVHETLYERVDELIGGHKGPLLSTTGTHAAIRELIARSEGLEKAIREIAVDVQELAAAQGGRKGASEITRPD